jgi:hypothetical protein
MTAYTDFVKSYMTKNKVSWNCALCEIKEKDLYKKFKEEKKQSEKKPKEEKPKEEKPKENFNEKIKTDFSDFLSKKMNEEKPKEEKPKQEETKEEEPPKNKKDLYKWVYRQWANKNIYDVFKKYVIDGNKLENTPLNTFFENLVNDIENYDEVEGYSLFIKNKKLLYDLFYYLTNVYREKKNLGSLNEGGNINLEGEIDINRMINMGVKNISLGISKDFFDNKPFKILFNVKTNYPKGTDYSHRDIKIQQNLRNKSIY